MPAPRAANAVDEMCLALNPRSPRCQTGAVSAAQDLSRAEVAGRLSAAKMGAAARAVFPS